MFTSILSPNSKLIFCVLSEKLLVENVPMHLWLIFIKKMKRKLEFETFY